MINLVNLKKGLSALPKNGLRPLSIHKVAKEGLHQRIRGQEYKVNVDEKILKGEKLISPRAFDILSQLSDLNGS